VFDDDYKDRTHVKTLINTIDIDGYNGKREGNHQRDKRDQTKCQGAVYQIGMVSVEYGITESTSSFCAMM
jgi:hypothetical protein